MTSETIKNITLTIEAIFGVLFSIFMMYSMWKTKKAAERISDNAKELSQTMQDGLNNLSPIISNMISQRLGGGSGENKHIDPPLFFTDPPEGFPVPDIHLGFNNILLNPETKKPIMSICCMDHILYEDQYDRLKCFKCEKTVNEKGEPFNEN